VSSTKKRVRELLDVCAQWGVAVEGIEQGKHIRLRCQLPDGTPWTLTAATSPSDRRSSLNEIALIRRAARAAGGVPR
jgi:hypothetical protein